MDSDIKYEFQKLTDLIDGIKRGELYHIKEKLGNFDTQEIKYALKEIKDKIDNLENKIQK